MPKITAGLRRNPKFTELTADQKYMVKNIGEPGFFTRVVWSLGFGNGKSVALYLCILKLLMRYPGIQIWLGRNHYTDLKKSNMRLLFEIIPKDIFNYKIYGGQNPTKLDFPNGSSLHLMGFGDPGGILGSAPGAVFIEEVSELDITVFDVLEGRVRQTGIPEHAQIIMGVGNPRGHYPLYQRVCQGEGMTPEAHKQYLWYKGDPFANKKNLPKNYYENLLARWPKELRERFVLGSDDTNAGQVYDMFNREIHIESFEWQDHWIPYVGFDYGMVDPTVALFLGFDPYTGDVWQIGEYYKERLLVPRHCELMDEMADSLQFPKEESIKWGDSNIASVDGGTGKSIQDWFSEGGWLFNLAAKKDALLPGIEKIKNLLIPKGGGIPKYHLHPRCVHTIEEFTLYEWKQPKGSVDLLRFKEEPEDRWNHCMDALRYAVNAMPIHQAKENPHKTRGVWEQLELAEEEGKNAIIWNPASVPTRQPRLSRETDPYHFPLRDG